MKLVLALLALILAGVLALQWGDWPPHPPIEGAATADGGPPVAPVDSANPLDLLQPLEDKDDYAVVTERPLFMPDRRPPQDGPEVVEEEPVADLSLDKVDLNAVLITPQESLAWVLDARTRELRRLRHGDDIEGWSVRHILHDRLVLERQGQTNTLVLRDYATAPPTAARPRQGARPPPRVPAVPPRPAFDNRNPRTQPNAERSQPARPE